MSEAFDPLNLLLLAVAVVIFLRLRSVLGRRTGNERRPYDPFSTGERHDGQPAGASQDGKVIPMPGQENRNAGAGSDARGEEAAPVWEGYAKEGSAVASGLEAIAGADRSFTPKSFVEGARAAYEMIVTAFAEGDRRTLRNLLSRDVFDGFSKVIDEREKAGQTLETSFVGIDEATIVGAELDGRKANVTVRFVSELITATKDSEGRIVDGDPKRVREVTDVWTFMRDVTSRDPNWKLVATEASS
ncbi:Tim44 domain-containing protein [Kaustia mangrovi]|uniref:Tim44 domain-containing protein n=1 Tax=Kaustia mangrovi TaxID=2593653 RepID=A0A7S8C4R3_9HYPH|nr:Tim44/TimA family putative adaptor protein [Kaustia mangrovi]QPC43361.1 Tim44 domain-containing protein [Kaustia mangrovi]